VPRAAAASVKDFFVTEDCAQQRVAVVPEFVGATGEDNVVGLRLQRLPAAGGAILVDGDLPASLHGGQYVDLGHRPEYPDLRCLEILLRAAAGRRDSHPCAGTGQVAMDGPPY
jgi:hypothetical protein